MKRDHYLCLYHFEPPHHCLSDGRLAVNLGTMVFVYEPRFDGGELYHHEAYSVPCPEPDPVVLDLQCFPGKVFSQNLSSQLR